MPHDVFSDVLSVMRMNGSLYFETRFTAPWSVAVPRYARVARFHLAVGGACWVEVSGVRDPVLLSDGDLIVVPHGASHVLSDEPGRVATAVDEIVQKTGFTGEGALVYSDSGESEDPRPATRLICGHFHFDDSASHPLLDELPPYVLVEASESQSSALLKQAFQFIIQEVESEQPGRVAIINRLSEILFVQVLRTHFRRAHTDSQYLLALADPSVGRALQAIHARPEYAWTLQSLSDEAYLSRAQFAKRFHKLVGSPPMRYLLEWRVRKAAQMLRDSAQPIAVIARRCGFGSESSFRRAFRAMHSVSPVTFRGRIETSESS